MNENDINLGGFTGFASDPEDLTPAPTETHDEHDIPEPAQPDADMRTRERIRRALLGVTTRQKVTRAIAGAVVVILACVGIVLVGRAEPLESTLGEIDAASALEALTAAEEDLVENGPGLTLPEAPTEVTAFFIASEGITSHRGLIGPVRAKGERTGTYISATFAFNLNAETGRVEVTYVDDLSVAARLGSLQQGESLVRPDGLQPLSASVMTLVPPRIETLVKNVERVVYKDRVITKTLKPRIIETSSVPVVNTDVGTGPVEVEVSDGIDTDDGPQAPATTDSIVKVTARVNLTGIEFGNDDEQPEQQVDSVTDPAVATILLNGEPQVTFPEEPGVYSAFLVMNPELDVLTIETTAEGERTTLIGDEDESNARQVHDGVIHLSTGSGTGVTIGERPSEYAYSASLRAGISSVEVRASENPGMRRLGFHIEELYMNAGLRTEDYPVPYSLRDDWMKTVLRTSEGSFTPVEAVTQQRSDIDNDFADSMSGVSTQVLWFEIPSTITDVVFEPQVTMHQTRVILDYERVYSDAWHQKYKTSMPSDPAAYEGMSQFPYEHTFYSATLGQVAIDLTKSVQEAPESTEDEQVEDEQVEDYQQAEDAPMGEG